MNLKDIFTKKSEIWTYAPLTPDQIPDEPKTVEDIPMNKGYLNITVRSMHITDVRKFTSTYYGVVHSVVKLNHQGGKDAVFQNVTSPSELKKLDGKHLDRVIVKNIPIVSLVPYRGEEVSLELGLFSVKQSDLAAPFIDLLETMASTAGVSVLSAAVPFVEPLKKGIDGIIGTDADSALEIGIATTFNPPKTGWFVVMRTPKQSNIIPTLEVTPSDYVLVDKNSKEPLKDYPYVIYSIAYSRERNDWFKLPYLMDSYQAIQKAIQDGKDTDAEDSLKVFKRYAITSPDILREDAIRICKLVEEELKSVLSFTLETKSIAPGKQLRDLESYPLYQ
ncbi:hypothetical protein [Chitinophaga pinensis]|nr:hypothetical protein [Chitinophaga pinensis]